MWHPSSKNLSDFQILIHNKVNRCCDMPTFRALSQIVNLASPSKISFIFEKISLRDANFGLPDFGAFLMNSTPDLNLFFQRLTLS